jgi:hypothetical protein
MPYVKFIVEAGQLGSDGSVILPSAFKGLKKDLPLTKDFKADQVLGHATVYEEGDILKANADIGDSILDLTPAIGFEVVQSHEENGVRVIDEMKLQHVSLSDQPNADASIKSIREQLKNA